MVSTASDSDQSEFEDLPARPKRPTSKNATKPETPALRRGARGVEGRVPTDKQKKNDKENHESALAMIERLKKQVSKLKKTTKNGRAEQPDVAAGEDDIESEEEDEDTNIAFSSSITPLAATGNPPQETSLTLVKRKLGAPIAVAPTISRRQFIMLPSTPTPTSSTLTPSSLQLVSASVTHDAPADQDSEPDPDRGPEPGHDDAGGKRLRSPSPTLSQSAPPPKKKKQRVTTPPSRPAELREGYVIIKGVRPKASDYSDVIEALLLRSMLEYESLISTRDAFPSGLEQAKWARATWKSAGVDSGEQGWDISERLVSLTTKRGSRIRGHVLGHVRPLIALVYGFSRNTSLSSTTQNRALYETLTKKSAFHYKDPHALSGYAQNKIISEILHLAWFENKFSQGVTFRKLFDPIPIETLAFIFTLIEFCLREWSTGSFVSKPFREKDVLAGHLVHRADLERWSGLDPTIVKNIRTKLYNRARRSSGIIDIEVPVSNMAGIIEEKARQELEGRTGETDSEMSGLE